jgi:glycosyltransferase involved in cell wall biosynthesis
MTIIHVSSALSWRGGEQQIAYLLSELSKREIQQIVLCPEDSPLHSFCTRNSIEVKPYRKKSGLDPWLAFRIVQLCRSVKTPLIHVHDSHSHTAAFLSAILWMNKTPVIVHRRVSFPVKKSVISSIKYNHNSIARIICVSEYVRRMMNLGLAKPDKTCTVYDGIDLNKFIPEQNSHFLRDRFQLDDYHTLIGNVSAITVEKDYITFTDTAEILLRNRPDLRFFIIGEGSQREFISEYIKGKGLADKIFMPGFLENIQDILPELDLVLFTSIHEGLGTTLLDAFACRIPVVSTNAGGIPEIVKDRLTGLATEIRKPDDMAMAVAEILDSQDLKNELVENAFRMVQEFSTEKMASQIVEIYKETFSI